jgi:PhoPQ-activated pathogenicity-related protein
MHRSRVNSSSLRGSGQLRTTARRDRLPAALRTFHLQLEVLEERNLLSAVAGRHIFYNESPFDGSSAAISAAADETARATDKAPYIPNGTTALFTNVTSYTRGINGIMVDLTAGGNHVGITLATVANHFEFRTGNNNTPGSWAIAPAPTAVSVIPGGGVSGSDRVEITWATSAIKNQWLQVKVLANATTGLSDVGGGVGDWFFWGNRVGDSGTSPSAGTFDTTSTDAAQVFATIGGSKPITDLRDYNRDGAVTSTDAAIVFASIGSIARINVAAPPPALSAALANDTGPGGVPNADGITQNPAIAGALTSLLPVSSFLAGLDAGPLSTNVLGLVQPNGQFAINEALLNSIYGSPLPDGAHTLHLRAQNSAGQITLLDVPFTLKRSIGTPQLPDLTVSSDTGASSSDNITGDDTPTITVTAELGSIVTLYVGGLPVGQQTAGPTAQFTLNSLNDGNYSITASAVDGAGNVSSLSSPLALAILTAAPTVGLTTLVTFGDDQTPHVTVTASSALALANGTAVVLDVDINNDGDFDDPGELGRTASTLYQGGSYFELTPALPATNPIDGPYLVQLRARVTDIAGNEGASPLSSLKIDTLGSTALFDYVNAPDASYTWSQVYSSVGSGYTYYVLSMRSQTWRLGDVNDPYWDHYLKIVVPTGTLADSALLLINGGSNTNGIPTSPDTTMRDIALATRAVTVELRIVPNESVYFFDELPITYRTEDEIISYTFDQFVNNIGAPGNETWPLLLPMVKSAVRAMDTVQVFVPTVSGGQTIDDFVVTGYSKRGWTTWLTGAVDTRVHAIIPGVIDLLNMDESMVHHYGFYSGEFAPEVGDYQDFDIIQNSLVEANQELGRIVDPYRYLFNSNLTNIPKLLLNSTGDEFFVPDSGQFYLHDLPGTSYVRYIPNTGHGLDSRAGTSTLTFLDAYLNNRVLPQFSWTAEQDGSLRVQTVTAPTQVLLWQATNLADRDFRKGYNPGITWTSTVLANQGGGVYVGNVAVPATGARAYMIELTFPSAIGGTPYVFTTEVRVKSPIELTPWAFYMPSNEMDPMVMAAPTAAVADDESNALAISLTIFAVAQDASDSGLAFPSSVATTSDLRLPVTEEHPTELMFAELSWLEADTDDDADTDSSDEMDLLLTALFDG